MGESTLLNYVFFFFKQKTAYEMRISDWSSDVCSSDLDVGGLVAAASLHGRRSLEKPSRRAHPALLASAEEPDRMTTITMNDGIEIYRKDWGPGQHVVLGHGCRSAPMPGRLTH